MCVQVLLSVVANLGILSLLIDLTSNCPPVAIFLTWYTYRVLEKLFSFLVLLAFVCAAEEREDVLAIHYDLCD